MSMQQEKRTGTEGQKNTIARLITNTKQNTDSNVMVTHSPLTVIFVSKTTVFVLTTLFPHQDKLLARPRQPDEAWSRCIVKDRLYSTWWVLNGFCTSSRHTPVLHRNDSQPQCLSMCRLGRHDLREKVCDLLTATMAQACMK